VAEEKRNSNSDVPSDPLGQHAVYRILDAAANRCREGLRVVEDYARMRLNDSVISTEIKEIRHALTAALNQLGQANWVHARDTIHDVGTQVLLASELSRESQQDVLRANLKRVEESLRSLEEYGKTLDAEPCAGIARCRYRIYTVEKALEAVTSSRLKLNSQRVCLLVTAAACRKGLERVVRESVEAGIDLIQVREKEMADGALIAELENIRRWTAEEGGLMIVNDRPDLAALAGGDGVHLGQEDLPIHAARRLLPNHLIGLSTHSPEQAREAVLAGANYLGVGPVFPSQTKNFSRLAGLGYVSRIAETISLPWFAIGGITLENLDQVQAAGATRIAISREICAAEHPGAVAREFLKRLDKSSQSRANP
jgi:thiamine-phosphate pyrophosphorylase